MVVTTVQTPGGEGKRIRENQATIQDLEEQLTRTGHTQIASGSQGEGQIFSPVASYHSETNRSVAKSHYSSQSHKFYRRRQGYKGKNNTTSSQRVRELDSIIQKLLDLVQKVHKNQKKLRITLESLVPLIEILPPLRLNIILSHLRVT
ncbi:hypothetical protein O181_022456 [Austropuccinia psidii MF-1]|uniref:Uncharacterized protein n=1 Tax=Austropuccinia psidii MF-1 TaxID=1389203 RepID=A0A9Q3GWQ0_9BASI|nr:hypothetical protein [Austropuccinia psidii MF-1]